MNEARGQERKGVSENLSYVKGMGRSNLNENQTGFEVENNCQQDV